MNREALENERATKLADLERKRKLLEQLRETGSGGLGLKERTAEEEPKSASALLAEALRLAKESAAQRAALLDEEDQAVGKAEAGKGRTELGKVSDFTQEVTIDQAIQTDILTQTTDVDDESSRTGIGRAHAEEAYLEEGVGSKARHAGEGDEVETVGVGGDPEIGAGAELGGPSAPQPPLKVPSSSEGATAGQRAFGGRGELRVVTIEQGEVQAILEEPLMQDFVEWATKMVEYDLNASKTLQTLDDSKWTESRDTGYFGSSLRFKDELTGMTGGRPIMALFLLPEQKRAQAFLAAYGARPRTSRSDGRGSDDAGGGTGSGVGMGTGGESAAEAEAGLVIRWSHQNLSRPEKVFTASAPVTAICATRMTEELLVFGGTSRGSILFWNGGSRDGAPIQQTKLCAEFHECQIAGVFVGPSNTLISIDTESKVCLWSFGLSLALIQSARLKPKGAVDEETGAASDNKKYTTVRARYCFRQNVLIGSFEDGTLFTLPISASEIGQAHLHGPSAGAMGLGLSGSARSFGERSRGGLSAESLTSSSEKAGSLFPTAAVTSLDIGRTNSNSNSSPQQQLLLTGSLDWTLRLWDIIVPGSTSTSLGQGFEGPRGDLDGEGQTEDGQKTRTPYGQVSDGQGSHQAGGTMSQSAGIQSVLASPNCALRPLKAFEDGTSLIFDVLWSPLSRTLFAVARGDGELTLWDLSRSWHEPVARLRLSDSPLVALAWALEGTRLLVGSALGELFSLGISKKLLNSSRASDSGLFRQTLQHAQQNAY